MYTGSYNYIMLILVLQRIEYHLHISSSYILSCYDGTRGKGGHAEDLAR